MSKTLKTVLRRFISVLLAFSGSIVLSSTAQEEAADKHALEPMIPIYKDPPSYPRSAYEQDIEGWVHAQFVVSKDGTVNKDSIVILDEEPAGVFTRSAIRSAESLRFNPRLSEAGTPIDAEGITYLFRFVFRPPNREDKYYSDAYTGRLPPVDP